MIDGLSNLSSRRRLSLGLWAINAAILLALLLFALR